MYMGWQTRPESAARGAVLEYLYVSLAQRKAVHSVPTCTICEEPGVDHLPAGCKGPSPSQVPERCSCPSRDDGHSVKLCPNVRCYQCSAKGHQTSTCTSDDVRCYWCLKRGHGRDLCTEFFRQCALCNVEGHSAFECDRSCKVCHAVNEHATDDCPQQFCLRCRVPGNYVEKCRGGSLTKPVASGKAMHSYYPFRMSCFSCGRYDHVFKHCTLERDITQRVSPIAKWLI
jgi:hypothetical protein